MYALDPFYTLTETFSQNAFRPVTLVIQSYFRIESCRIRSSLINRQIELPMVNKIFSLTNDTTFYVGVFLLWSLLIGGCKIRNKQPIEIGVQISPVSQPIGSLQNRKKAPTQNVVVFIYTFKQCCYTIGPGRKIRGFGEP